MRIPGVIVLVLIPQRQREERGVCTFSSLINPKRGSLTRGAGSAKGGEYYVVY
jgi:hypothetical protein